MLSRAFPVGLATFLCMSFATAVEDDGADSPNCRMALAPLTTEQYLAAVDKTVLTKDSLRYAEGKMIDNFSHMAAFADPVFSQGDHWKPHIMELLRLFNVAVSARVRGMDEVAALNIKELTKKLRDFGAAAARIEDIRYEVYRTADDPDVYPAFAMAEFIMQNAPSVEFLFYRLLDGVPGLKELRFAETPALGPIIGGPRQAEMVRAALQYSVTRPGDRVLEIGYGTPMTMLAIRYFTNTEVLGVDANPIPENANAILRPKGIELVQGIYPDSPEVREKVNSSYSLVYALDTLKKGTFMSKISGAKVARSLYSILDEGGTLVILNDYMQDPIFTLQAARAAGFTIVRWGARRSISPHLKKLMPYKPNTPNAGQMALFVLRRGNLRPDRIELRGAVK